MTIDELLQKVEAALERFWFIQESEVERIFLTHDLF